MSEPKSSGFSVFEMAAQLNSGTDDADLFKPPEPAPSVPTPAPAPEPTPTPPAAPQDGGWRPDPKLLEDMPEMQRSGGVLIDKDKFREEDSDHSLKNVADDEAKQLARQTMDALERARLNIEDAKSRMGIAHLNIPPEAGEQPGQYHASITAAAEDTDYSRGQQHLVALLTEISEKHPEFVTWEHPEEHSGMSSGDFRNGDSGKIIDINPGATNPSDGGTEEAAQGEEKTVPAEEVAPAVDTTVIIDKRDAAQVSFTEEDLEKIRKSRTVELKIVESDTLEFGEIEDISGNAVDQVLEQYKSAANCVEAVLPASKYRCIFIGLSYPEMLDLSNSNQLNNLDGEWKKWSICFDHIKNQSIGPWEEWSWYIDPVTKKRVELRGGVPIPAEIDQKSVHRVTKFMDFLMKTSYKDLQFMLSKILQATAMNQEIVAVHCTSKLPNGQVCDHNYDWVYSPADLIEVDKIDPSILEDMEKTSAATGAGIMENYKTSLVQANNTVKLKTSGFQLIYGHVSAYQYLNSVYAFTVIDDGEEAVMTNPTLVSESITADILPAVKGFLIPTTSGKWSRVTDTSDIVKILQKLDEFDMQTVIQVAQMVLDPYNFRFSIRNIKCPNCGSVSDIDIPDLRRLLFIVARSLSNVQIELKKI